jgi:hypothetical protein
MANESQRPPSADSARPPMRSEDQLDREPASNRGTKGQMRESRKTARDAEEDIQTMAGHDDSGQGDRVKK